MVRALPTVKALLIVEDYLRIGAGGRVCPNIRSKELSTTLSTGRAGLCITGQTTETGTPRC